MTQKNTSVKRILKKKFDISWMGHWILIWEIVIMLSFIFFLYWTYGISKEYVIIGGLCLLTIYWRVKYRK